MNEGLWLRQFNIINLIQSIRINNNNWIKDQKEKDIIHDSMKCMNLKELAKQSAHSQQQYAKMTEY
jgi:ABC-type cobalamin/Fe3+-siderophores transport system ATPase subunit